MRIVSSKDTRHVFNLERGEELFETLLAWCEEYGLQGATFTGLGAADRMEIAYYNLHTKTYERQILEEEVEILSLTGNMGFSDGVRMLHIHGVMGRRDLSTFGGHLFSMRISGACEIHLEAYSTKFNRSFDDTTGLKLLCEQEGK